VSTGNAIVVVAQALNFAADIVFQRIGNFQMMTTDVYLHRYFLSIETKWL
jgi:hypothetical protein